MKPPRPNGRVKLVRAPFAMAGEMHLCPLDLRKRNMSKGVISGQPEETPSLIKRTKTQDPLQIYYEAKEAYNSENESG